MTNQMSDDPTSYEREGYDLCYCGCTRGEHDPSGRCHFCFECEGFEYDHDATCVAAALGGAGEP